MSLIVHHLNNSRSQRILWLLEELNLNYEIRHHQRDAVTNLAPPELLAVHPLGKSPVIEDDGKVIYESQPSSNISANATAAHISFRHAAPTTISATSNISTLPKGRP